MKSLINFKEKGIGSEIVRFIITGIIATVIDFICSYLVSLLIPESFGFWKQFIYTTVGFTISVVANYHLSMYWVYKNVDKSINVKSKKNIILFVCLSAVGLFIGISIMIGFKVLDNSLIKSDFENCLGFIKGEAFSFKACFWAVLFFGVKTLVTLIWNYITRKKLIFKSKDELISNK